MPFCDVGEYASDVDGAGIDMKTGLEEGCSVQLYYQLFGHGPTKVLLIPGVAATYEAWGPQLLALCGTVESNEEETKRRSGRRDFMPHCVHDDDAITELARRRKSSECETATACGNGVQVCGGSFDGAFDDENRAAAAAAASSGTGVQVCAFDNRGVGRSSAPKRKKSYTTLTMAKDALALMDHLGWNNTHVVGHSMGGMIACKLGAIAPERVVSLALISTTGGGYECLPKIDKTMISIAWRFLRAKTPEERAHVDLDTHYTKEYLDTLVDEEYRRAILYREYVKNLSSAGMQPKHGLDGQFNACWYHHVKSHEIDRIRSAGISVAVIHGRGDIVAQIQHAQKLANKLHPVASMTELTGGHMVTHQNAHEVNKVLLELIRSERVHVHTPYNCNSKVLHDVHKTPWHKHHKQGWRQWLCWICSCCG
ncbi:hypothetical protein CY35_19G039600 [Sphagnum magellanicum]|nr:hypothetical protein CY35_19G039600 [Sphagnum magellanicum]